MANSVVVRQEMDKSDEHWKFFPPFLWLLRDVLIHMPERNGRELTPTEFLTTEVLSGDNSDSVKVAVYNTLTRCFPTFECKTLPPPSTDKKVMAKVSTSLEKLDSLFNQGVDELIAFVKANIKAKKVFDAAGAKCDGPTFAIFVKKINEAVNDPQSIPALDSTWKLVVESRCRSVQERILSEYCNSMKYRYDETSKGGPIEEVADHELEHKKSLMGIHDTLWSELRKHLNDELGPLITLKVTRECSLEMDELEKQLIQTLWETDPSTQARVKKVVGGALLPIAEENRKRSWKFCNQLFADLYTPIREQVQMTEGEDGYTPDKLAADIKALVQEYDAKSVGPEKWKVRAAMETTIKQNKELFQKHLHEVLQYAKKEREAKEMYENLRNELQELKESRNRIAEKFDNFAKQQQEAEERRQQEFDTEMKELKEKLQKQEEKEKEMNAKEMKRRIEDSQQLTENFFLRERAEEKLKEMEKTLTKNREEELIRKARADEETQKLKQKIEENKLKEAKRKEKLEQEIDGLKAQIKEAEQKLKQKDHWEEDEQKAEADNKIKKMEETLREKEKKEAEEEAKHQQKLRQKAEEYYQQQLIIERMKDDHERMVNKIKQEKEEERKQKELVQKESRITIDCLNQLVEHEKAEKELQKKEWEKQCSEKEKETSALSNRIDTLSTEVESLTEEKEILSSKVETLSVEKGALSSKVKTLSDEKGALSSKVETLSKEKGTLSSQVATLSKEKGTLSSKVETLSKEKGTLSSKVETLSVEKGALSSKVETLSAEKRAMSRKVEALSKALSSQVGTSSSQVATLSAEKEAESRKVDKLKEDIDKFEKKFFIRRAFGKVRIY